MENDDFDRELRPSNVAVIREVYDSENAYAKFEMELERALEVGCAVIIIEPEKLGEDTSRWIKIGIWLHRFALGSGLLTIIAGVGVRNANYAVGLCMPLCCVSFLSTTCLAVSWQLDPCYFYRHETDRRRLTHLAASWEGGDATGGAVVLFREENVAKRRSLLHGVTATLALALTVYRVYTLFK